MKLKKNVNVMKILVTTLVLENHSVLIIMITLNLSNVLVILWQIQYFIHVTILNLDVMMNAGKLTVLKDVVKMKILLLQLSNTVEKIVLSLLVICLE
jgi:hypothetical protein